MVELYCRCDDDDGVILYLEILSFISVSQFNPYSVRAVCTDRFGNITTPSVEQLKIISENEYLKMRI